MQRILSFGAAAIAAMLAAPMSIGAAQGLPCDPVIVDDASVLSDGFQRVADAASALERRGAIVRVRTIRTFGDLGSLDHFQKAVRRQCLSWQATNGENRDGLVAIFLAVDDHEFAIYTGADWANINDAHGVAIQTDIAAPYLRRGDFAGGFVAAMEEFGRLMDQRRPSVGGTPMHGLGGGAGVVVVQQSGSRAGGSESCAGVGIAFLVIIALALLVLAVMSTRRSNQRRRAAQEIARDKRHAATSGMLEARNKLPGLKTRTGAAALMLSEADAGRLKGKFEEIDRLIGALALTIQEVEPEGSQDPTRDGRSREEYETVAKGYERALEQLRDIQAKQVSHDAELDALHLAAKEAPAAIDAAEAAIGKAGGLVSKAQGDGWKIDDVRQKLSAARDLYIQATTDREGKRLAAAKAAADRAKAGADEVIAAVAEFPQCKARLDSALRDLEGRIAEAERRISEGRVVFDRVSARYAESSWDDIAGNGSQAEAALASAREALESGRTGAAMDQQRWKDAEAAAQNGNTLLDRADALVKAIAALETRLQEAERSARPEIDAAAADLERAAAYEHAHDADIDDTMKAEIARARTTLEQARAALAADQPDFLEVVRLAKEANSHADRILAKCQSEHEAAERLRQQAESAVRDADSAVAKARSYMSAHSWDVEAETKAMLRIADGALTSARAIRDPQQKIAEAKRAKTEADRTYRQARADVESDDGLSEAVAFGVGVAVGSSSSRRSSGSGIGGGYSAPSRPSSSPSRSSGRSTSFGGGGSGGRSSGKSTKW